MRTFPNNLGDLIDTGERLRINCEAPADRDGVRCNYSRELDLVRLAGWLGRDQSYLHDDLVPHLFCPKCRSKKVSITMQGKAGSSGWFKHHAFRH